MILKDDIIASDVQPYQEVDVRFLLPPPEFSEAAESNNSSTEATDTVSPAEPSFPLNPIASLILLATAQDGAEEILLQARTEAEALKQEAYEQGLAQGCKEGEERSKAELFASLAAFAHAEQSLLTLEQQLVTHFAQEIVQLALEIGEKIVRTKIEEDPTITASVLERARSEVSQARNVTLWLHPVDYKVVLEYRPDLVKMGEEGGRKIEVFTSETISRGGCRVETELGVVDATIPVQMDEIRKKLLSEG
ncbi:MAG: FliH/SctL family protein [Candidatus Binatia bacterium]